MNDKKISLSLPVAVTKYCSMKYGQSYVREEVRGVINELRKHFHCPILMPMGLGREWTWDKDLRLASLVQVRGPLDALSSEIKRLHPVPPCEELRNCKMSFPARLATLHQIYRPWVYRKIVDFDTEQLPSTLDVFIDIPTLAMICNLHNSSHSDLLRIFELRANFRNIPIMLDIIKGGQKLTTPQKPPLLPLQYMLVDPIWAVSRAMLNLGYDVDNAEIWMNVDGRNKSNRGLYMSFPMGEPAIQPETLGQAPLKKGELAELFRKSLHGCSDAV